MFKLSARTRALVTACLQNSNSLGDEDENNSALSDVIEGTPESSPTNKFKRDSSFVDANRPVLSELEVLSNETMGVDNVGDKSIEPPPYSPLTPKLLNNLNAQVYEKQCTNSSPINTEIQHNIANVIEGTPQSSSTNKLETAALVDGNRAKLNQVDALSNEIMDKDNFKDKSIEPPPYSPLTPRLLSDFNARYGKQCMSSSPFNIDDIQPFVPISEKNTVSPISLPSNSKQNIIQDPPSSPLRPMSPETTNLYNILTEVYENNCESPENIANVDENRKSTACSDTDRTETLINSDDSVQDPDFICYEDNASSDSSPESESLLTTRAEVYEMTFDANELQSPETTTGTPQSSQGRPKKGRKRLYGEYNREERKKRKYLNLPHINSKKQHVESKKFLDFNCNCPRKCQENILVQDRLNEFKNFYSLGSYEVQNMFIAACVKEIPVKRRYVSTDPNNSKKRIFSREYHLKGVLVCQKMFLKTLQISAKRINTSLSKKRDNSIKDMRGKKGGHNKVTSESEAFIINVIQKLPTYISHYRRENCNDAKFLRPDMTFSKIYKLYSDEAKSAGQDVLSMAKVKKVFLTKFNLRTKPLKKDTCNKCDYYFSKKNQGSDEEKALAENNHKEHIDKAKSLQNQLKSDMKLAQEDPFTETITFDLQKTLPLPRIPTNVVFYKRQLWVYNLGIHAGSNDQAYCNIWVEGEAGRGSQEVGSCLIKHAMDRLKINTKHLILWSDSCGGQNRNIKLTLMLKTLLNDHPTLQTIRLRFLESGHSFLPNDTDFGRIECALKLQQRLYTPEDYIRIMQICKTMKPMQVYRMRSEDFLSSLNLEKRIINRKKACDGSKVSWLNTKEILLKKEDEFSLFMRCNLDEEYVEVDLKKNTRGNTGLLSKNLMDPLWPNGKPISEAKLNVLKSLLHLIPADSQNFYKKLTGDVTVEDDVDGFSGEVDFEIEVGSP